LVEETVVDDIVSQEFIKEDEIYKAKISGSGD
jgi:hypothetical protein